VRSVRSAGDDGAEIAQSWAMPEVRVNSRDPETLGKTCVCTGIRWCAACSDPALRSAYGMYDPLPLAACLAGLTPGKLAGPVGRVAAFDVATQRAPRCPDFDGVVVVEDFVSIAEAEALLAEIEAEPFAAAQSGKQKQHYGPKINFKKRRAKANGFSGLPRYTHWLEDRLRLTHSVPMGDFETTDVFVLRYEEDRASNLDFHRDDTFAYGEAILDFSLESDSVLTFLERPMPGVRTSQTKCVRIPLPARSLAVLYGRARFSWDHAILAYDISGRRTSITLRTLSEMLCSGDDGDDGDGDGRRILDIARGNTIQG
jgi:alkylated DNA repair dioxygenase AlkB